MPALKYKDPADGQWKYYPSTTGATGPGVPTGGTPGQVLGKAGAANFDTTWIDQIDTGGVSVLDDLTDVSTPSPVDGQALTYVGSASNWQAKPVPTVTVDSATPSGGKDGDLWVQTTDATYSPPSDLPRGIVAWKVGGSSTTIATATTILTLTSVPLQTGRLYKFTFGVRAIAVTTLGTMRFHTPSNGAVIANTTLAVDCYSYQGTGTAYSHVSWVHPFTVTVDANYTLTIQATNAGTAFPQLIMCEDIGPVRGQQ